jgi:hypothetical protein
MNQSDVSAVLRTIARHTSRRPPRRNRVRASRGNAANRTSFHCPMVGFRKGAKSWHTVILSSVAAAATARVELARNHVFVDRVLRGCILGCRRGEKN